MRKVAAVFITILLAASSPARIITVDDDGPADFTTIQAAIDDANDGDTVRIQPGTYTGDGNRDIDFLGKAITVTSTDPNDPNTVAATVIDCEGEGRAFIFQTNEDPNSILDGLTIVNSSAYSAVRITGSAPTITNCTMTDNYGHAIYCEGATGLNVTHCLFTDNTGYSGGAIWLEDSTSTIANCVFRGNSAEDDYSGGAIRCYENVVLNVADCTFQGNSAINAGAISTTRGGKLTVEGSVFIGNIARFNSMWDGGWGGAIVSAGTDTVLTNCLFAGNFASQGGAALYDISNMTITNCTFAANYSWEGTTLFVYDAGFSSIQIRDSIIWDGPDSIAIGDETSLLVNFSDVQGMIPGYRNIDADPCFVDPGRWVDSRDPNIVVEPDHNYAVWVNGDYHLKSQAGRWDSNEGRWTTDEVTSPCIDAGDPNTSIGSEPFPNGGRINMGVYGGTIEASKSYFGKPTCQTIVAGDINGDCVVNGLDFSLMAAHWLGRQIPPGLPSGPNPASNPSPYDGETAVSTRPTLTWKAGIGAKSHNVYLGDTDPPEFKCNQTGTDYVFPRGAELEDSTRYYWRIDEVSPYGTTTGLLWTFTTGYPPSQATAPNPPDDANNVGASAVLSWTADPNATSQKVYFGTTNPPPYKTSQTSTTFAPASLAPATTYYWRIDQVNSFGTTTGEVWTFRTGTTPPGQATNPNPADDANNLNPGIVLSWSPGSDAKSHDVYFGTTSPGTFKRNQTGTTYDPGSLSPGTTYYWRIDEIGWFGTTIGTVWSFTTGPLPEPPTNPDPADGTIGVGLNPVLSWTGGAGAQSCDVYFGTMSDYRNRGNQTGTTFNPGTLSPSTQYYWRIGEINVWGTTYGPEWTFTTQPAK